MAKIAEKINRFNAYVENSDAKNKLAGITEEVTLPDFKEMSESLNLAGMGGEIDSPTVGNFESAQIEIPFSNISSEMFRLVVDDSVPLILRSAQEELDTSTLKKGFIGRVVTVKGMTKEVDYGKLKKGGYGEPKVVKEIVYYKDEHNGKTIAEIDKFNNVYVVNGVDMMKDISKLI